MKILLINKPTDKKELNSHKAIFNELKIDIEEFTINPDKDLSRFTSLFDFNDDNENMENDEVPGYILVISSLSKNWYDFLAGFSCGSSVPLLIFGQDAIPGISHEFESCYTFFENESSLKTFFEFEAEAFKKQEAAREIIRAQNNLLKRGVPVTVESLAQCVAEGKVQELGLFITAGFSPDTKNKTGIPLLNIAARNNRREIIEALLSFNAELNIISEDRGSTALIDSVMTKNFELMKDLLKAGINVNIQSKDGQTALIIAVGIEDEKYVEALLNAGSDPDIEDSMGMSARQYAMLFSSGKLGKYFNEKTTP